MGGEYQVGRTTATLTCIKGRADSTEYVVAVCENAVREKCDILARKANPMS